MSALKLFYRAVVGTLILALGSYGLSWALWLLNQAANVAIVAGILLILVTIVVVYELGRRTIFRPW